MNIAYIMRGIPGSGKSTIANLLAGEKGIVCSTDFFFTEEDGSYNFDPAKLAMYHKLNLFFFHLALANNVPIVVCDNTNIRHVDYKKYVEIAREFNYIIKIVPVGVSLETAVKWCRHNVPRETIKQMLSMWED